MKRHVLHLIDSFHQGGTERQAVQLVRLLHEAARYRIYIACLDKSGVLLNEASRLGVGYIPEYHLTSFYNRNALKQLRRFAVFLREREIDIVHTHDFYTNIFGMVGAALARTPVRIAARRETNNVRTNTQKHTERAAYKFADAVIANAEAVRRQLIAEGVPEQKTRVIYNGLDMRRVALSEGSGRDEAFVKLNVRHIKGRQYVTIIANLRLAVKDHPMFLRAAKRVRERVPEATFLLAGEGDLTGSLQSLAAQLGLQESAIFLGRCEHVAELLSISDVCVLSSKAEGFSNSILEYMAAARPVVATDVGDELFAGYTRYGIDKKRGNFARLPRVLRENAMQPLSRRLPHGAWGRNYLHNVALDPLDRYIDSVSIFTSLNQHSLYSDGFKRQLSDGDNSDSAPEIFRRFAAHVNTSEPLDSLLYLDSKTYLPGDILTKVDRMSMAVSLETRAPLLDHKLIEFVTRIPASMKMRGLTSKYIFKKAIADLVPPALLNRPKQGFGVPVQQWINQELRSYIRDVLTDKRMRARGYFNERYIDLLFNEHESRRRDHSAQLWALFMLELWHRTFTDASPATHVRETIVSSEAIAGIT